MTRVAAAEVKQIINTTLDPLPFIEAASVIVSDRLSGKGLSETTLKEIERWISAHFLSIRQPIRVSQSIDGASERFQVPPASMDGLKSTSYGLQALLLDSSGTLANLGKRQIGFEALDISLEE